MKSKLHIGDIIEAEVYKIEPYGVFANIGFEVEDGYKFSGIVDIGQPPTPGIWKLPRDRDEWPKVGDRIKCVVVAYRDSCCEVDLGIKT